MAATWLKDAVFYEIYPQSFYDTNGDGIGDINGIIEKLGYIKDLGCNALWINPCFDSPFKDAGYDVRDYKKVAPRYGTNEDLVRLFHTAHDMGIRVLLDLVPGHTSEEHEWFRMSQKADRNEYSDRFIWTDFCFDAAAGFPYIGGESERSGTYVLNFFKCQPALNYGFFKVEQPWQLPANHPAATATREAIKDIMRFWLEKGCDGFRVDMASSLVKNDDEKKTGTSRIWRDVRRMLDLEFPDAAMVSEWSNPPLALRAGYDCDFCLNVPGSGYSTLMRDYGNHKGEDHSYFKKDAGGSIGRFLDEYLDWYEDTKDKGYISMLTCNHDTIRPRYNLDERELKLAYATIFTLPGVPFLYYGDEIGMRYQADLVSKEGGFSRTGSRTPMQWCEGKNLGFSTSDEPYLPVDKSADAPTVENQKDDPDSIYRVVTDLIALRHKYADLHGNGELEFMTSGDSLAFAYRRGSLVMYFNPTSEYFEIDTRYDGDVVYKIGQAEIKDGKIKMQPQSFLLVES